jgi:hypothetical protein
MSPIRIIGAIFLTVGLVIASVGGYFFSSTQDLVRNGLRASGTVIELRKAPTSKGYTPVVQFETADHQNITAVGKIGSNPPAHKAGDSITVIYRADSPDDIVLDDPLDLYFFTYLFGGIGSVFVLIGGGMLIFSIFKPQRRAR